MSTPPLQREDARWMVGDLSDDIVCPFGSAAIGREVKSNDGCVGKLPGKNRQLCKETNKAEAVCDLCDISCDVRKTERRDFKTRDRLFSCQPVIYFRETA